MVNDIDVIYEKAYEALCKKIGCIDIIVQEPNYSLKAKFFQPIFDEYNPFFYYCFWIKDAKENLINLENLKIDFQQYDILPNYWSKKEIVMTVLESLKNNYLIVNEIMLEKGLTVEKLMIEYDLSI